MVAEKLTGLISEELHAANGHARVAVPKIMKSMKSADERVVEFVRERPVAALCAAAAVGYVVGRIFTRFG